MQVKFKVPAHLELIKKAVWGQDAFHLVPKPDMSCIIASEVWSAWGSGTVHAVCNTNLELVFEGPMPQGLMQEPQKVVMWFCYRACIGPEPSNLNF